MTTKNPEIPPTLPPEIQQLFDRQNAGYSATADEIVKRVADAKAAAQADDTKLLAGAPGGAADQVIENDPTPAHTPRPRRQRVRSAAPAPTSAPTLEPTLADAGLNGRAEVVRFGDLNREELFKEFQSFDFTDKVKRLQAANKALRTAMDSVVRLHGFKDVKAAVRDLDGKSLIFKKTREGLEQALGGAWQAKQFKGIDPDKLFLEYHDVLVAAEEVLDNLRLQHLDRAPEDLSRPDTLPIKKLEEKFPGLLDQIRAKAKEWEDVCGSIEDQQVKSFIQAVRERLQRVGVPHVKRIADELTSMNPDHGWRGEMARKDMLRAIRFHGTLEQLVEAARSLSKQFPQKEPVAAKAGVEPSAAAASSAVDLETELARQWRGWRGKPLEKVGAVERAYQRWLELDQQIRQFHDENRLRADLESSGLKEDKVGKILLLAEDNEAKAAKLQSIREDIEAGKELDDKEAGFLTANFHGYGQLIAAAERIVKEREAESLMDVRPTAVATPTTPPDAAALVAPARRDTASSPADPAATTPSVVPSEKKRFNRMRDSLDIEQQVSNLRREEEIGYRDEVGNLYIVRPTPKSDKVFELWYPDRLKRVRHVRELAAELHALGVAFDSKARQNGDASDVHYDPTLSTLTPDQVMARGAVAEGVLRRETREARVRLEREVQDNVKRFIPVFDAKLKASGMRDAAERISHIAGHIPMVVNLTFERFIQKLDKKVQFVLSPAEQTAMIQMSVGLIDIKD